MLQRIFFVHCSESKIQELFNGLSLKANQKDLDKERADRIEGVEKMREAGVGRIMVPGFIFGGPDGMERLQEFGENVVSAFNTN